MYHFDLDAFSGWFFILQAIVFIQHITVCIIVPFVTVQSAGNAIAYWNLYHCEYQSRYYRFMHSEISRRQPKILKEYVIKLSNFSYCLQDKVCFLEISAR